LRIIALIIKERVLIIALTFTALLVSSGIAFFVMPNWYASSVNAVPAKRSGSGLDALAGGLSSALKDVGLARVGGKSGSESYSFTVILNSRRMKDTIIKMYRLHEVFNLDSTALIELRKAYDEKVFVSNEADGNYVITVLHTDRQKAAEIAMKIYELGNVFADELFQAEARTGLGMMEKRFQQNDDSLASTRDSLSKFSRRYKLYAPLDQAKAAASAIADLRVQQYQQELRVDVARSIYGDQDAYTQVQRQALEKIGQQASRAENQPGLVGNFALGASSEISLEYMRLYADLEVYTKIKALLIPSLEQSRQDLQRHQPSLILLDPAVPADKKDSPKRSLIIGSATLGTLIFAVLFVVLRDRYRALRRTYTTLIGDEMQKLM
jgi:capsule polysaccharide export protein KpsE/RkpR